jgi:hypothetical protein
MEEEISPRSHNWSGKMEMMLELEIPTFLLEEKIFSPQIRLIGVLVLSNRVEIIWMVVDEDKEMIIFPKMGEIIFLAEIGGNMGMLHKKRGEMKVLEEARARENRLSPRVLAQTGLNRVRKATARVGRAKIGEEIRILGMRGSITETKATGVAKAEVRGPIGLREEAAVVEEVHKDNMHPPREPTAETGLREVVRWMLTIGGIL